MTIENQPNTAGEINEEAIETVFEEIKEKFEKKKARFLWKPKEKYIVDIAKSIRAGGSDLDIVVNGVNQGKIKAGKSVSVTVDEPEIEIVAKAMGLNPLKGRFKLEKKAYIELSVWKNNIIFMNISGAETP